MRAFARDEIGLPASLSVHEVFLLLPGLNFLPDRMAAWGDMFLEHGAATLRPTLTGYAPEDAAAWRHVTGETWLADVGEALLRARSRFPQARVSAFGYSLGALLALEWSRRHALAWHRLVLLAPAVGLKGLPRLGLGVAALLPGAITIPSAAPRRYRVHALTSLAAYHALDTLTRAHRTGPPPAPAASFWAASRRDELISLPLAQARQESWAAQGSSAGNDGPAPDGSPHRWHWIEHTPRPRWLHHLAVDEFTLGAEPWRHLRAALGTWLEETAVPGS